MTNVEAKFEALASGLQDLATRDLLLPWVKDCLGCVFALLASPKHTVVQRGAALLPMVLPLTRTELQLVKVCSGVCVDLHQNCCACASLSWWVTCHCWLARRHCRSSGSADLQLIWAIACVQEAFEGTTISKEPELSHQGAVKFFTSGKPPEQQAFHAQRFGDFKVAAAALSKAAEEAGMSAQLRAALDLDSGEDIIAGQRPTDFVMTTTTKVCGGCRAGRC